MQISEPCREVTVLGWRQILVLEEEDLVAQKCGANVRDGSIRLRFGKIDAMNNGTNGGAERFYVQPGKSVHRAAVLAAFPAPKKKNDGPVRKGLHRPARQGQGKQSSVGWTGKSNTTTLIKSIVV
jgi:hypothetical protein